MLYLRVVILLVCLVGSFALNGEISEPIKYSFDYPRDWKMIETPNAGVYILGPKTQAEEFRPNISVQVKDTQGKESIHYYTQKFITNLKESNSRVEVDGISQVKAPKENTEVVSYHLTRAGEVIQGRAYLLKVEDKVLIISCSANDLHFERIEPVFETIVSTFKVN